MNPICHNEFQLLLFLFVVCLMNEFDKEDAMMMNEMMR